jgi:hypothetical protein
MILAIRSEPLNVSGVVRIQLLVSVTDSVCAVGFCFCCCVRFLTFAAASVL